MFRLMVALLLFFVPLHAEPANAVRVATFNIAMGLETEGELGRALSGGDDARLQQVAEILQRVRPDIVLLNEFDYDPSVDAAALFNENYLANDQNQQPAIAYPFHHRATVNTGIDSGMDLDGNGVLGEPADAWGFGRFPGQYGMLVLSRYPLANSRSFRTFRWADLPRALRPRLPDGNDFYPDVTWRQLRLSSKSHWDLEFDVGGKPLHLLALHPTPPVFDGPEDRNGRRNFDEIRLIREYVEGSASGILVDDAGTAGGLVHDAAFVIVGDLNADPNDGDAIEGAIGQLLASARINTSCTPASSGGVESSENQAGINASHRGDPAHDTSDFNDRFAGNLRLDYVLPSDNLKVSACGVFWPASGEAGHELVDVSDHRLVWADIQW